MLHLEACHLANKVTCLGIYTLPHTRSETTLVCHRAKGMCPRMTRPVTHCSASISSVLRVQWDSGSFVRFLFVGSLLSHTTRASIFTLTSLALPSVPLSDEICSAGLFERSNDHP